MRTLVFALVMTALSAGMANAGEPSGASTGLATPVTDINRAPRPLYVCEDTATTTKAFARKFGSVAFVKAEEAQAAHVARAVWAAPRCITPDEVSRLRRLVSTR